MILPVQPVLVGQVVAGVQDRIARRIQRLRQGGDRAGPDHEVAGPPELLETVVVAGADLPGPGAGRATDLEDVLVPVQSRDAGGGPAAVRVVVASQRIEGLAHVEGVELPRLLEPVQERVLGGGIGHGHQVRQEGDLQRRVLEEQPGMPVEARSAVQEGGAHVRQGIGQAGQPQAERPEAHAQQVQRLVCGARLGGGAHGHRILSAVWAMSGCGCAARSASTASPARWTSSRTARRSLSCAAGFSSVSLRQR